MHCSATPHHSGLGEDISGETKELAHKEINDTVNCTTRKMQPFLVGINGLCARWKGSLCTLCMHRSVQKNNYCWDRKPPHSGREVKDKRPHVPSENVWEASQKMIAP